MVFVEDLTGLTLVRFRCLNHQQVKLQAKEALNESESLAAMVQLHHTACKQTRVLHELHERQRYVKQLKLQNEHLSDRKDQVSKAVSSLRKRQQNLLKEELKADEACESATLKSLLSGASEGPPTQQVIAAILEAVARAQWLAVTSDMVANTWKSLAYTLVPATSPTPVTHLPSQAVGNSATFPTTVYLTNCQELLERQVSFLTSEFHEALAESEKYEMEGQAFEANLAEHLQRSEMKAETETAQRLDLWRKKLFETCATLLREPGWQTAACAEMRELGLETEVEELASMNKIAQERIAVLSSQVNNSHTSYLVAHGEGHSHDPFYGRQQVSELKSQLSHVRKELRFATSRCERLEADLPKGTEATLAEGNPGNLALEHICSAVTSMAERVEHMCMEADTSTRHSSGHLVLQELANSKKWCEEVHAGLMQQAEDSAELNASHEVSRGAWQGGNRPTEDESFSLDFPTLPSGRDVSCDSQRCGGFPQRDRT